jgi:hypothetical protein
LLERCPLRKPLAKLGLKFRGRQSLIYSDLYHFQPFKKRLSARSALATSFRFENLRRRRASDRAPRQAFAGIVPLRHFSRRRHETFKAQGDSLSIGEVLGKAATSSHGYTESALEREDARPIAPTTRMRIGNRPEVA